MSEEAALWSVRVNVTNSADAGPTSVDLLDSSSSLIGSQAGTQPNFSVTFDNVPDGSYKARVQYFDTERFGEVTVSGGNAEVTVDMGL